MFRLSGLLDLRHFVPLAIIVATLSVYSIIQFRAHHTIRGRLDAHLRDVARDGYPTTLADLKQRYGGIPARENGAEAVNRAGALLHNDQTLLHFIHSPGPHVMYDGVSRTVAEVLPMHREVLRLSRQAARRGRLRFAIDLDAGASTVLRHHRTIGSLVTLNVMAAYDAARRRDASPCMTSLRAALRLSHALREEPTAMALMRRLQHYRTFCAYLPDILNADVLSDAHLAELAQLMAETRVTCQDVIDALSINRVLEARQIEVISGKAGPGKQLVHPPEMVLERTRGWTEAIQFVTNASWADLRAMSDQTVSPHAGLMVNSYRLFHAKTCVNELAVAALRYRKAHGHWPEKSSQLHANFDEFGTTVFCDPRHATLQSRDGELRIESALPDCASWHTAQAPRVALTLSPNQP